MTILRSLVLILVLSSDLLAISISGSLKPQLLCQNGNWPEETSRWMASSSLRLMGDFRSGDVRLKAAWVLIPSLGDPPLGDADVESPFAFRIDDPDRTVLDPSGEGTSASLIHDLDRLNLSLSASSLTFVAGRQAIYWGVAKSVSPTDFISPFRYGSVDTEYRGGVDAIRLVFPVGMLSEVETGYVAGNDFETSKSGAWLRGRFYILKTDASLIAARYRNNLMIGGSINRALGRGTAWLETAYIQSGRYSEPAGNRNFLCLSAGYDRSWFDSELYGYLEYHYSSAGGTDPSSYLETAEDSMVTSVGIYLAGRHYLCPGISWFATPLLTVSLGSLINVNDPSAYVSISGEYSAGQNTVISAGINWGIGSGPDRPGGEMESEFGPWPDMAFLRTAYYF